MNTPSPSSSSSAGPKWLMPVTCMTFILGGCIGLALKTQNVVRSDNLPSSSYSGLSQAYTALKKTMTDERATIGKLQRTNQTLVDTTAKEPDSSAQSKVLGSQIDQARFAAGMTDVAGPGIVVTLNDSKHQPPTTMPAAAVPFLLHNYIVHDGDLMEVVNELRAAGAEAFAINNQRIIATTAIRCVGPAIQVNGVPITPPYNIRAIGNPDTLATALDLPGGVIPGFRQTDPAMIAVTKSKHLLIPAYDGATVDRYAKPVLTGAPSGSAATVASADAGHGA